MTLRIGEGWDIHRLVAGRPLLLGGVHIPFKLGLLGHSDADVLLHAITDALLGASGLGDIGHHFPDTDPTNKNAASGDLLQSIWQKISADDWSIENIDSTIIAQQPRLAHHIDSMRNSVAKLLSITYEQINIKAKTAEKLGPVGDGLAIEARAVILLSKK
jgi:2-C-methyl-D-erythritol 2,4-cyclodiphosphate synthase